MRMWRGGCYEKSDKGKGGSETVAAVKLIVIVNAVLKGKGIAIYKLVPGITTK